MKKKWITVIGLEYFRIHHRLIDEENYPSYEYLSKGDRVFISQDHYDMFMKVFKKQYNGIPAGDEFRLWTVVDKTFKGDQVVVLMVPIFTTPD